ncbi:dihydroorotate dehydrogenase electron transfer subunit [candidate division KSB1 bacterium]
MKDNRIYQRKCRIVSKDHISQLCYIIELDFREIAESSKPGQFVQIKVSDGHVPLLRRPFSVFTVNKEKGTFSVLFKVFGKGTDYLSKTEADGFLDIIGPLGNSFQPDEYKKLILVAGGVGMPPLYNLINSIKLSDYEIYFFFGASTREELFCFNELDRLDMNLIFTTDDGSAGIKGLITKPLEKFLIKNDLENSCILACGPTPMLAAVQDLSVKYRISAQLSTETMMACGIGLCQSCVLPKKGKNGKIDGYKLTCIEGPVFKENELVLK